jgi:hypothetical protein
MSRHDRRPHLSSPESDFILHELDLGGHILVLLSDGSIELVASEKQTPSFAETGLHLDSDETYRLFISLYEQFKHPGVYPGDERAGKPASKTVDDAAHARCKDHRARR